MISIIIGINLMLLFCIYMLFRNNKVYNFREGLLDQAYYEGRDFDWYDSQPSYNYMMFHFWVWPLSRFILGGKSNGK